LLTFLIREPFIASFWQMALPELRVPGEAYKLAVARFESSILKLDGWLLNRNLTSDWIEAYRSNKAELSSLSAKLKIEEELQKKVVETAASRVSSEKSTWFSGTLNFIGRKHRTKAELVIQINLL
jgi:hypothetical protein